MKKLIVIGIVAVLVMGFAMAASAGTPDTAWVCQFRAINSVGVGQTQSTFTIGTKTNSTDAWLSTEGDTDYLSPIAGYGEMGTVVGTHTRVTTDYFAPLTAAQDQTAPKVIDLYARINGGTDGNKNTITISGWVPSTQKLDEAGQTSVVELWLASDYGVTGKTALWSVPQNTSGTSGAPNYTSSAFAYTGTDIGLKLVAYTPTPEPGSILVLASGLVGLAGFGIRRRK